MSVATSPPQLPPSSHSMLPHSSTSAASTPRLPPPSSLPHFQHQDQHQLHGRASSASAQSLPGSASSPLQSQHTKPSEQGPPSPGGSPVSSHSSPYVSPRLHNRVASDPASAPLPFNGPPMRRGAVSGASGPLSFPPLPSPFRHASAGPGDGAGSGSALGTGPRDGFPPFGQHHSGGPHGTHDSHYSTWGSTNGTGSGRMGSISAASGPHFPLPSSYSLSSGVGSPIGGPNASSSSSSGGSGIHNQRRGGLSASSGVGVYGAATAGGGSATAPSSSSSSGHAYTLQPLHQNHQSHHHSAYPNVLGSPYGGAGSGHQQHQMAGHYPHGMHPYWTPMTGNGLKRKQTSANPPPRNYACPSCPASFSRRHDLNRHSRIHLAVKPFGCPNCAKTFSRKDALKRHLMVKGCGKDAEGRPRKRRGRKSAAEKAAMQQQQSGQQQDGGVAGSMSGYAPHSQQGSSSSSSSTTNPYASLPYDYSEQQQYANGGMPYPAGVEVDGQEDDDEEEEEEEEDEEYDEEGDMEGDEDNEEEGSNFVKAE